MLFVESLLGCSAGSGTPEARVVVIKQYPMSEEEIV